MAIREALRQKISDAAEKVRVRSALNPILWLCAIVTPPGLYVVSQQSDVSLWVILVVCVPVGTAAFGFLFLLFFDRDKLQSEDYQLRMRSLDLIQEKGEAFPIAPTSLEAISNPEPSKFRESTSGDLDQ